MKRKTINRQKRHFDEDFFFTNAKDLVKMKIYDQALDSLDILIDHSESLPLDRYFLKAKCFREMNLFTKSLEIYDECISLEKQSDLAFYKKGTALLKMRNYEGAIECFQSAISINKKFLKAYSKQGYAYYKLEKFEDALVILQKGLVIDGNDGFTHFLIGDVLSELKKLRTAIKCYDLAIGLDPQLFQAYNNKGNNLALLSMKKKFKPEKMQRYAFQAIKCFKQALALNPNFYIYHFNIGRVLFNLENYERALVYFTKATGLLAQSQQTNNNINQKSEIVCSKANCLKKLKRFSEAIEFYNFSLEIKESLMAYKSKGECCEHLGRYAQALDAYLSCKKLSSGKIQNFFERKINKCLDKQ